MAFVAGSVVAPLTIDLAPFQKGIGAAKGMAGELKGGLDKVFGGIGSVLTSPVAKIAELAGGLLTVAGAVRAVSSAMDAIDAAAKAADQIGITTQAYAGLTHAAELAGIGQEEMGMSLRFLQKSLADVADGAAPQAQAALDKLGLSGAELANLPVDQALGRIGDKLAGVTNAAERTSIAADLLGMRGGPKLLSLLSSGTAGMADGQKQAEAYGIALSRVDAAKVEQANDAMTNAKAVLAGVAEQVAVGVSPVIQKLAEEFVGVATAGSGVGPKVGSGLEYVASGIAAIADYLNVVDAGWHTFRAAATTAVLAVVDVVGLALDGVEKLSNSLLGTDLHYADYLDQIARGMRTDVAGEMDKAGQAMARFDQRVNSSQVSKFFDDARKKSEAMAKATADAAAAARGGVASPGVDHDAVQKAADELAKMQQAVATFGQSDAQKGLAAFAQMKGVTPQQIASYKALADQLDRLNQTKDLSAKADEVKKAIESPAEAFKARVAELDKLRQQDLLSEREYQKAVAKAQGEAMEAEQKDSGAARETSFASFMKAGSNDVAKLAFSIQRDKSGQDVAKEQLGMLKEIAAIQRAKDKVEQVAEIFGSAVSGLLG